jgi:hypothetical protein
LIIHDADLPIFREESDGCNPPAALTLRETG